MLLSVAFLKRIIQPSCIVLALMLATPFVSCADTLRAGLVSANQGQNNVEVPIYATFETDAIVGFQFGIRYDNSLLELVEFNLEDTQTGWVIGDGSRAFVHETMAHKDGYGILRVALETPPATLGLALPPAKQSIIAKAVFNVHAQAEPGLSVITPADEIGDPLVELTFFTLRIPNGGTIHPVPIPGAVLILEEHPKPQHLRCHYQAGNSENGRVLLLWDNPREYTSIAIERDGEIIIQDLPGDLEVFIDDDIAPKGHEYRIMGVDGAGPFARTAYSDPCSVYTGKIANLAVMPAPADDRVHIFDIQGGDPVNVEFPRASTPSGVAIDAAGAIWITAAGADRLYRLTPDGDILNIIRTHSNPGGIAIAPGRVEFQQDGRPMSFPKHDILVLCREDNCLMRIQADGTILWGGDGAGDSPEDGLLPAVKLPEEPELIACGPNGNIWITCPESNQVVRVAPNGGTSELDLSGYGSNPSGIAIDQSGNAWVATARPAQLVRINYTGRKIHSVPLQTEQGALDDPQGITMDMANGVERILVTHPRSSSISAWDTQGNFLQVNSFIDLYDPMGISADGTGELWIPCSTLGIVVKLSADLSKAEYLETPSEIFGTGDLTGMLIPAVVDPEGDNDSDGYANLAECLADANPFDDDSDPADSGVVAPVENLSCRATGSDVRLTWTNHGQESYDTVRILRNRTVIASIKGTNEQYIDPGLPGGIYRYEVIAGRDPDLQSAPAQCVTAVGRTAPERIPVSAANVSDITILNIQGKTKIYALDKHDGWIHVIAMDAKDGEEEDGIPSPFGSLGTSSAIASGSTQGGEEVIIITGRLPDSPFECLVVIDPDTGQPLSGYVELNINGETFEEVIALDYHPDLGYFSLIEDLDDPDIFTFTMDISETQVAISPEPDLSPVGVDLAGTAELFDIKGMCFSPMTASTQDEIYLVVTGPLLSPLADEQPHGGVELRIHAGGVEKTDADIPDHISDQAEVGPVDALEDFFSLMDPHEMNIEILPDEKAGVPSFIRGDPNLDGSVNLGDAIKVLTYLYTADDSASCMDAFDGNDDGGIDLADAITILSYLYTPAVDSLPLPHESCGPDPTDEDALGCDDYSACD